MPITSQTRNKIDKIRNYLFGSGFEDPLTNAEQLSFLFFFYLFEFTDKNNINLNKNYKSIFNGNSKINNSQNQRNKKDYIANDFFRWSNWSNSLTGNELVIFLRDEVFPFYEAVTKKNNLNILADSRLQIDDPIVLKQTINLINKLELQKSDEDTNGDLFEYVLKGLKGQGELGQFRTPRHIIDFIIKIIRPKINETIYDPSVGTAGFLVSAFNYIKLKNTSKRLIKEIEIDGKNKKVGVGDNISDKAFEILDKKTFYGNDTSKKMVRLSLMNLYLRGLSNVSIFKKNTLTESFDRNFKLNKGLPINGFDIIFANPPFSGTIDSERITEDVKVGTSKSTQTLFIKHILNSIKNKGRCGIVVPEGTLSNDSAADNEIKRQLLELTEIKAIISLPSGVFKPYAGVKTSILIIEKGKKTKNIFFYKVENDGYLLDENHDIPIDENDLPDAEEKFFSKDKLYQIWKKSNKKNWNKKYCFASVGEIKENSLNLSMQEYLPLAEKKEEKFDIADEINQIENLENLIIENIKKIKKHKI